MLDKLHEYLGESTQLLFVKAKKWNSVEAVAQLFERLSPQHHWHNISEPFPVVLGKSGMAWGKGLMPVPNNGSQKREGDHKAPAGLFSLGKAFGYGESIQSEWPYQQIDANLLAVDDPHSCYYNQIIDSNSIADQDWNSAEVMLRPDGLYRYGMVINYNMDKPVAGAGSCIFMHIWRDRHEGTEGCTAMSEENIAFLLESLDPHAKPLLLQLPEEAFSEI